MEDSALDVSVGIHDLVLLPKLSDTEITQNLKKRFSRDVIYTNIGSVLVSVNPFQPLPLYTKDIIQKYNGAVTHELPPHIYSVAENAFRSMLMEEEPQAVIISGESGAGKTEASKQLINYIAEVSGTADGSNVEHVKNIIIESNPLLESFGNAKTLRNNNSSRFGKYFEILFDEYGHPRGGKIETFLLEKSRTVGQMKGERDFHIFYQLLCAPDEVKAALGLGAFDQYRLLKRSGTYTAEGQHDAQDFNETMAAMKTCGLKKKAIQEVLKSVTAVLNVGNVTFKEDNREHSSVHDQPALEAAALMLQVEPSELARCLTQRHIKTPAEEYDVPNNADQAGKARDALAKAIYFELFDWLITVVNEALDKANTLDSQEPLYIGVLDIYGFECFESNGFEQLCINYVNEMLQQLFIENVLRSEQDEYSREGIEWKPIKYFNNKVVCDLIDERRPPGIFCILDDVCATMHAQTHGADRKLLEKLGGAVSSHPHFRSSTGRFTIKHYAGDVEYTAEGMCERNKDTLYQDIVDVMRSSKSKLLQAFFPAPAGGDEKRRPTTTAFKIKEQARRLIKTLMDCTPHYIRTIKSNDQKKARIFDLDRVKFQVQYLGLLQNCQVRRAGFAYRQEFGPFNDRYAMLSKKTWPGPYKGADRDATKAILKEASDALGLEKADVQIGKNKVFLKHPRTLFDLETLRKKKLGKFAKAIQRCWRWYSSRKYLVKLRAGMAKALTGIKRRRAESIFLPFNGIYGISDFVNEVQERCQELLPKGTNCRPSFLDELSQVYFWQGKSTKVRPVTTVLLDRYLVFLAKNESRAPIESSQKMERLLPVCILKVKSINGVTMTTKADDGAVISCSEPEPFSVVMQPDKDAKACNDCGRAFTLTHRRHHCRGCGNLYCSKCCPKNVRSFPCSFEYSITRSCAKCFYDQPLFVCQDFLVCSPRRTEMVACIMRSLKAAQPDVNDTISCKARCSGPAQGSPPTVLNFTVTSAQGNAKECKTEIGAAGFVLHGTQGLPEDAVAKHNKAEAKRRAAAKKRREAERIAAEERRKLREAERAEERKARIAEKKARKKADKAERERLEAETEAKKAKNAAIRRGAGRKPPSTAEAGSAAPVAPWMAELAKRKAGK